MPEAAIGHDIDMVSGDLAQFFDACCEIKESSSSIEIHEQVDVALFVRIASRVGAEPPYIRCAMPLSDRQNFITFLLDDFRRTHDFPRSKQIAQNFFRSR